MTTVQRVRWSECYPVELQARMKECPVVYLPIGLCEPHGQISVYGLDLIKAEYLCEKAALCYGGVVAPSLGYTIHETGFHAGWLEEVVGDENPRMTSIPPHVLLYFFIYQLRSFANAGFSSAFVLTGHAGGNEHDLRLTAALFQEAFGFEVQVFTDGELVADRYAGDHAGKYEISQLMHIRPDFVDLALCSLANHPGSDGTLAIGSDAMEASQEYGRQILEATLEQIGVHVSEMNYSPSSLKRIGIAEMEQVWLKVLALQGEWRTSSPLKQQLPLSRHSQWQPYERPYNN
ncbi:creatininase family protein [Paenibacillus sp. SI8]|uniref:creatininase family protein n=1 Tax=unclassified Paenibacillus TaxID=185978 RepID=UPI003465CC38